MGLVDRISIEPSRFCSKGCSFCYNGSSLAGRDGFSAAEVIALARDCAANGVKSVSIGGGEPLEWSGLFETLEALRGVLGRSFTTNGLELIRRPTLYDDIVRARPDKVHVSLHSPESATAIQQLVEQVLELDRRGVSTGVNLLVRQSRLDDARDATVRLEREGITRERIVFLPARGIAGETPSAEDVAWVATGLRAKSPPFMSMSCLSGCGRRERFVSIGADRTVAACSYTVSRRRLRHLSYAGLLEALPDELKPCHLALARTVSPESFV